MIDLCEVPVGKPGRAFILSILDQYPGLCAQSTKSVAQQGDCYAILPKGTSIGRAEDFDSGNVITEQSRSKWLQGRIENYVAAGRRGVFLVQDLWCNRNDHVRHPPDTTWFVDEGQVYFWEEFGDERAPDVRLLIDQPKIPDGLAAFLLEDAALVDALNSGRTSLAGVADSVSEVYVPAYDDESFVMWVR